MKKQIRMFALLAALVAFAAPSAFAQGGGQGGGRGRMMEMLMKDITLTDVQKTSVDSIVQVFRAQMPAMTPGTPPDSAARAQRMEVMQKQNAAIRTVLTADQQKVFDKNVADVAQQMGRPRP